MRISKLEAAKRQIDTALRLYFAEGDEIAVHTLGAAALQILLDLREKKGLPKNLLRDRFLESFRPESIKGVLKKLAEAENFLKHADRDPDEILEFTSGITEYILSDAVVAYEVLGGRHSREMAAFETWLRITSFRPHIIDGEFAKKIDAFEKTLPMPLARQTFFAHWRYAPDSEI